MIEPLTDTAAILGMAAAAPVPAGFLGIDTGRVEVDVAIIAALAGLVTLILRGLALLASGQQNRRRELFSEGYKAAMAWGEMLYRVRRRGADSAAERALVERFHDLQERIDYYEGWTSSEGRSIGRSYCELVRDIKREMEPLIQAAWGQPGRLATTPTPPDEAHPNVRSARDRFLGDVRAQLSLLIVPRLAVWWRNRETKQKNTTRSRP